MNDPLQREFYAEMCRVERWSVWTLREKINGMLYERTTISRKPAELARQELDSLRDCDLMTPDLVFRDVTRPSKRTEQLLKETAEIGKFDCLSA